jgi:hypothetical protein
MRNTDQNLESQRLLVFAVGTSASYVVAAVVLAYMGALGWFAYALKEIKHLGAVRVLSNIALSFATILFMPMLFHLVLLLTDSNVSNVIIGKDEIGDASAILKAISLRSFIGPGLPSSLLLRCRLLVRLQSIVA